MNLLNTYKKPSFAEKITEIFRQNLYIAALWSSPVLYFDIDTIKKTVEKDKENNAHMKSLEIVIKAKNMHRASESYIKSLKINCLRKELLLNPKINDGLNKKPENVGIAATTNRTLSDFM